MKKPSGLHRTATGQAEVSVKAYGRPPVGKGHDAAGFGVVLAG